LLQCAGQVPALVQFLGRPAVHGAMSAAALLGPGRSILVSGFHSAARGAPDMNSLVSLGAVAAFGVSCVAAAMPQLAWRTFFEEPAMLLGVVLLGRTLEQRAKLQASSDMVALRVSRLLAVLGENTDAPAKLEDLLEEPAMLPRVLVGQPWSITPSRRLSKTWLPGMYVSLKPSV